MSKVRLTKRKNTLPGSITLITGPMFSGKTSEMIRRIKRHTVRIGRDKLVILKWDKDVRNREKRGELKNHDDDKIECIRVPKDLMSEEVQNVVNIGMAEVVGIDDAHFFKNLCEFCEQQANNGKLILVCGLNSNFKREPFKEMSKLFSKAEKIKKLNAICTICGSTKATFSKRTIESKDEFVVGGAESYTPVCRGCFLNIETHLKK